MYDEFKSFLVEMSEVSSRVIVPHFFRSGLGVEDKADASPVTIADRDAEAALRKLIEKRFPHHGIIGEEYGNDRADAEWVWILDPVDGTRSFITGVPMFTTLIGLLHQGKPIVGAIHQPILKQLLVGDGKTTTLNGNPVSARRCDSLAAATLLTTDPLFPERYQPGSGFDALAKTVKLYRSFGDGYGYLLVATGWADIMVDPIMNAWDLQPLIPVMEGAGVKITDWHGKPANRLSANSGIACVPELHAKVLAALHIK